MKRDLLNNLKTWQNSTAKKPLVLNGARQVGKTYLDAVALYLLLDDVFAIS